MKPESIRSSSNFDGKMQNSRSKEKIIRFLRRFYLKYLSESGKLINRTAQRAMALFEAGVLPASCGTIKVK